MKAAAAMVIGLAAIEATLRWLVLLSPSRRHPACQDRDKAEVHGATAALHADRIFTPRVMQVERAATLTIVGYGVATFVVLVRRLDPVRTRCGDRA